MRNIKISFEHPEYIYPFKLTVTAAPAHQIDRIASKSAQKTLEDAKGIMILSAEQLKILSSLSSAQKISFAKQYSAKLQERKQQDYLGANADHHYDYFKVKSSFRVGLKQLLQLHKYLGRLSSVILSNPEFGCERWISLLLLFHTNFAGGQIKSEDAVYQQLQTFIGLHLLVKTLNILIGGQKSYCLPLRTILHIIQDAVIQGYFMLTHLHFQQQMLLAMISLARTIINYLRERLSSDEDNPEHSQANGKKNPPSLIFWIINFNSSPKQSKMDMILNPFNPHTIFEIITKILPKTVNLSLIEEILAFTNLLFQEISGFGQLLFLITEAIRFEFPKTLSILAYRIKTQELKSSQMIKYQLQCQLTEFSTKQIEAFKLKQMIKIPRNQEKIFNTSIKQTHKAVAALLEDFQRYKKGKILFKRKKKIGSIYEEQVEERQILNIQKLAEESHFHYKSQQIISMELFRENQQLIKVNRWLEERLKKNQAIIAELLSINQKQNVRAKLKKQSEVVQYKIQTVALPSLKISDKKQYNMIPFNQKGEIQSYFKRTDSQQLLSLSRPHLETQIQANINRKSITIHVLPPHSQNLLLEFPKIDIPRERERKNSFNGLNQFEMSRTSMTFQEANIMINKAIEKQENKLQLGFLPPPPPTIKPSSSSNNILPPPPPLLLSPPQLLLPPPPLNSIQPPPRLDLPPLLDSNLLMPPIPPLLMSDLGGKVMEKKEDRVEMKNIGWNVLQNIKIKNSFWENLSPQVELRREEIVNYFGRNQKKFVPVKPIIPELRTILKPDRMKNVEIVLKKLKITDSIFPLLENAFRSYDQQFLKEQFLNNLLNLLPSNKQRLQYMEIHVEGDQWSLADRFLSFMTRIESVESKINGVLFKEEFDNISAAFFSKTQQFISYFQDLKYDRFFQAFLQYLLAVGNFLNEGTHRGNARAFRIQNIEKTYLLVGQDKQTSLFDYILDQMYHKIPELFDWPSLTTRNNIVPLSVLFEDYNYFQKKCQIVNQCILLSEDDPLDESSSYFLPFYLKACQQISLMKNQLEFASLVFRGVKQFYGDKLQSQEMAKLINDFRSRVGSWRGKLKNRRQKR